MALLRRAQQRLQHLRFAGVATSGKPDTRGPRRRRARRGPMRIILISDTHLAPVATAFNDNLRAAIAWIAEEKPDLVIHLGDVTVDAARHPGEFDFAKALLGEIAAPLKVLPGNHDVGDSPPAGGLKEPAFDPQRLRRFRETLGDDHWRLDQDGWTLIGLNALVFASDGPDEHSQSAWLQTQLATTPGPIALFLHKPLLHAEPDAPDVPHRFVPPATQTWLSKLFEGQDLRLVASGHVHQSRRRTVAGVEQLWVPSTAFLMPDSIQAIVGEKRVGVMTLELTRDGFQAAVLTPPGMAQHDVTDHPEVYPEVARLRSRP